jgi:hypothetical protein
LAGDGTKIKMQIQRTTSAKKIPITTTTTDTPHENCLWGSMKFWEEEESRKLLVLLHEALKISEFYVVISCFLQSNLVHFVMVGLSFCMYIMGNCKLHIYENRQNAKCTCR